MSLLDWVPDGWLFLLMLFGVLGSLEAGYRLARRRRTTTATEKEAPVGEMVAAQIGLLAFMLAFTFGIAASRYENRRQVLLDEANGIGTTYLRTSLLPEPQRVESRRLLRKYVDIRVAAVADDSIAEGIAQSEEIHSLLWQQAIDASADTRNIPVSLFVQSLNEVIDLHSKRLRAGLQSRIPMPIWGVLFTVTVLAFAAMGYHGGLTRTIRSPILVSVAVSFAAVIWLVANLDRPAKGMLQVSQKPLVELQAKMSADGS